MIIPVLWDHRDIKELEDSVLNLPEYSTVKVNKNHHYLEPVGYHLWMTWSKNPIDLNRNNFVTYMMPLIAHLIKPHIRFLNQNLEYEDLFQLCIIHLIEHMPKYSPTRINKAGTTSRVFTYYTLIIQYYIKTVTSKNWKNSNKYSSYQDITVGSATNGYTVYVDFINFLDVLRTRRNLRDSHRLIYNTLYDMLLTEESLHLLSANLLSTISMKCNLKRDNENILSAFRLLRKAYGELKFDNISYFLPIQDENTSL